MKKNIIKSDLSESSPRPWMEFDVVDGSTSVTINKINGVVPYLRYRAFQENKDFSTTAAQAVDARVRSMIKRHNFSLATGTKTPEELTPGESPNLAEEVHVLAVTLEGEVEFVPFSRQKAEYYAHLGLYNPATGEWEVLQFVENVV